MYTRVTIRPFFLVLIVLLCVIHHIHLLPHADWKNPHSYLQMQFDHGLIYTSSWNAGLLLFISPFKIIYFVCLFFLI